jgi:thiamine-phosphate pyrophosphorylase
MSLLKGLYVITDETLTPDESVHSYVEDALKAGARIVQYRNKTKSDDEVEEVCRALQALCSQYNVPFIIDDRPHLATKIQADGIHIGKNDMSLVEARKIFPKGIIGVSCYGSIRKAKEAQDEGRIMSHLDPSSLRRPNHTQVSYPSMSFIRLKRLLISLYVR